MAMNMVILTGRLTADPELKHTQSGKAYAKFSLAVTRRYNRDETDFVNIVAWEKRAELASQYLQKGSLVGVTGSLRIRSYEDENGAKRKATEVIVDNIEFLDKRNDSLNESSNRVENQKEEKSMNSVQDDEFPF